jgi:signal transduction histidine kinase
MIAVADGGPGIDAADTKLVFQRFWRSAGKREGTGLGLSYVRAAAEAHGGWAFVASSPLGGAQVGCRIPLTRSADDDAAGVAQVRDVAVRV